MTAAESTKPLPRIQLPPVIGHRGAAARAPENTLAGLRVAKQLGCSWVEFDARLTADGTVVLCHDPRLDRTTDGKGRISRMSLAAVRDRNAGSGFGAAFAGERVPTLEEALLLCTELGLGANIELKTDFKSVDFPIGKAVKATLETLQGRVGPILVSSFYPGALLEFCYEGAPPRGILFRSIPRDWTVFAERFGCTVIGGAQGRLRPRRVAEIRAAGYQLAAYTVNDPARARQLYTWGVTSVFSDAPDIIAKAGTGHGTAPAAPMRQGAMR